MSVQVVHPLPLERLEGLDLFRAESDVHQGLGRHRSDFLAGLADAARQPLGHDDVARGGDQERLDAHVEQTADGAGGVVGVERGEDEVAGEGGLDRDLGRLVVADLAHHDDVRVLPQEGAQGRGEGQADFGLDLTWLIPAQVDTPPGPRRS